MPVVFVTGAAGHVGATLVRALLAQGQPVRAMVHHDQRALQGLEVELVPGDVCDQEALCRACAGAQVVYHAAGHVSIAAHDWSRLEAVNVVGTRNVVEACLAGGVSRLVHFSSIEALVDEPLHIPVDEARPLVASRRYPAYARSKAAGELYVRQGLARGLDALILYPTAILGPYDYRLGYPNAGLLALASGRLWALVEGGFDWVDVRDVVAAALQATRCAPPGARYIVSGHWASLRDLAALVEEINGLRLPRLVLPMWLACLGAPFATALSRLNRRRPLYTSAALRPLRFNPHISHARAARDLDYHPRPLHETVADTLRWFEENGLVFTQRSGGRRENR